MQWLDGYFISMKLSFFFKLSLRDEHDKVPICGASLDIFEKAIFVGFIK